jgi:hypothetical protein
LLPLLSQLDSWFWLRVWDNCDSRIGATSFVVVYVFSDQDRKFEGESLLYMLPLSVHAVTHVEFRRMWHSMVHHSFILPYMHVLARKQVVSTDGYRHGALSMFTMDVNNGAIYWELLIRKEATFPPVDLKRRRSVGSTFPFETSLRLPILQKRPEV